jgi:hypothetical protein
MGAERGVPFVFVSMLFEVGELELALFGDTVFFWGFFGTDLFNCESKN